MIVYPLDNARTDARVIEVQPDTHKGEQKVRADGRPVYRTVCLVRFDGRAPEIVTVKVPSATPLKIAEMARVEFGGLVAMYWETGGRSGISVQAETVTTVGQAK
jgi:hypothetical protein